GTPKGAVIRHNGALNHILAEQIELKLEQITFLQTAPTSSDISVWQFIAPLITGGACVILDDVTDIPALIRHVDQHQVNIVELVPVVLTLLLDYVSAQPAHRSMLPSLKVMMATGEAVPVPLINRWLKYFPTIPITNAYGPTEAADDVIQHTITQPLPVEKLSAPIGKPLANFVIYILDANLRLVPPGIVGEICISGIGVGEGYWNNPDRTAQSFVANPYATSPDTERMYKTGDLGRWTQEGLIEYVDRLDNQIKIRGHRIELGEIEAQLAKHPQTKECAVSVREDTPGDKYVAAYVIALDRNAKAAEFKHFLKQRLPIYMVPRYVTLVTTFPTTPAGKIDRKNLPAPATREEEQQTQSVPTSKLEIKLAGLWQKALK
ncbi:MAG TPA: amino acid adenylation domain-containing protein, partial [Pseudomonadales bacterium]|nr:amino acid adenylation domain-containing protein [Pseudomonadales bacterium]